MNKKGSCIEGGGLWWKKNCYATSSQLLCMELLVFIFYAKNQHLNKPLHFYWKTYTSSKTLVIEQFMLKNHIFLVMLMNIICAISHFYKDVVFQRH